MIGYYIKSILCLALLFIFYHLVLEREKMHRFNRYYLLGSIVFSLLVPFYKIKVAATENLNFAQELTLEKLASNVIVKEYDSMNYLLVLYTIIAFVLIFRFLKNLVHITIKTKKYEKVTIDGAILVLVDENINPHTFWNYIFINKKEYFNNKIENQLYAHELTHVTQKHTFDVLLIEFLQAVFWINPMYIFLKKAIKLNHEFLADHHVLAIYKNTTAYQYLLLNRVAVNNEYYLASNLNYLLTKKRLLMMTKQSSQSKILLKKLAVLPLTIGFISLFAQRIEAQENATNKIVLEYNTLAEKYNNKKTENYVVKKNEMERLEYLYNKLSYKQKNNAEAFPNIPPPPPTKTGFREGEKTKLFYVKNTEGTTYYNSLGQKVNEKGDVLDANRTSSSEVLPNQNISKVYKDDKVVVEFETQRKTDFPKVKKGDTSNIPPPPPPLSPLEFIVKYKDNNVTYYLNDKKINHQEAINLIKTDKNIKVELTESNDTKIVKIHRKN